MPAVLDLDGAESASYITPDFSIEFDTAIVHNEVQGKKPICKPAPSSFPYNSTPMPAMAAPLRALRLAFVLWS